MTFRCPYCLSDEVDELRIVWTGLNDCEDHGDSDVASLYSETLFCERCENHIDATIETKT